MDDSAWSWRCVADGRHDGRYGEGGSYGRRRGKERMQRGEHDYERDLSDGVTVDPPDLARFNEMIAKRMHHKMVRGTRAHTRPQEPCAQLDAVCPMPTDRVLLPAH